MKTVVKKKDLQKAIQWCSERGFEIEDVPQLLLEYATEQTAKWRELYEAQKKLIEIMFEHKDLRMPNIYWEKKGELRQKISDLEKQLNLK